MTLRGNNIAFRILQSNDIPLEQKTNNDFATVQLLTALALALN